MTSNRLNLERDQKRAHAILTTVLEEEKIYSLPDNPAFKVALTRARDLTSQVAESYGMFAPGMTSCVATTFLKVGLSLELCQRFVFEYFRIYKEQNVSFIFLKNATTPDNHMFVFIGKPKVPDNLFVGRGQYDATVDLRDAISLQEFLKNNKEGVIADPLLKVASINDSEILTLSQYCSAHGLTQVIGVRSFLETQKEFVEGISLLKTNAEMIANKLRPLINLTRLSSSVSDEFKTPTNTSRLFQPVSGIATFLSSLPATPASLSSLPTTNGLPTSLSSLPVTASNGNRMK